MAVNILGKLRKAFVGTEGLVDSADVEVSNTSLIGVLSGVTDNQSALSRIDGTGIGADIFSFTGAYSAQASNINEWFGNKQLVRMRCTGRGTSPIGSLLFSLPGTSALNTAFDVLVANGLAERIQFVIEYTGATDSFINIQPRTSPSPQIMGTTSVIVRQGVQATLEITRTSGTISDYIFTSISQIAAPGTSSFDTIKLQNPAVIVWDASPTGNLPTTGVVKGNAYNVVNAPADGSGRFGEVMQTDDWVVWDGETFTSWAAEPHQWFVISAHDVRRINATGQAFLNDVAVSTVSDRNAVIRGADYATDPAHGEIRINIYDTVADYTPADLNTNGQIDQFTQASADQGIIAIRLTGTQSSLSTTLPNLYVYIDNTLVGNMSRDFTHRGDFTGESDYTLDKVIDYTANQIIKVFEGTTVDRYNAPNLDINESNLSDAVQTKLNDNHPGGQLPPALTALNNQARVFNLTHNDFRSNNSHVYLSNTLAVLKNEPSTFPNTAGTFSNEITGSQFSVGDPTPVTAIQDVGTLTNNAMTGAGIVDNSFSIPNPDNVRDPNNWRLIIGGWMYYPTLPTDYQPILQIQERGTSVMRDIFGMGPNGFTFKQRATTGSTTNTDIRHALYTEGTGGEGGLIKPSITASTLTRDFRVYNAETYLIQAAGYNNNVLQGGQGQTYTVTDLNTDQAATTLNFDLGAGTQGLKVEYIANSTLYGSSRHIIRINADSLISGIDEIRIDVLSPTTTVGVTSGNTYNDVTLSEGHVAASRLMRYIVSFRSINNVESGWLEAVIVFFGYDTNGNPRIFDENTIELRYPALDLSYNNDRYGGIGIHKNVQVMYLNADTPTLEFPRHATLRDWLTNYDTLATDYCWGNVHPPNADTEAVYFPEYVNFPNQIFVDTVTNLRYREVVSNGVKTLVQIT